MCHLTPLPGTGTHRLQGPAAVPARHRGRPGPRGCRGPSRAAGGLAKALDPRSRPPLPGPLRETPASFSAFPGPSGSFLSPRPRLPTAAAPRRASPGPRISPPRPAALTCEPRPGPSIVPVTRRDSAKRRRQPAGRRASSLPYPTSCSRPRLRRSSGSRLYPSVGLGRANPCSPLAWGAGLFLPSGRLLGEPRAGGPAPSPAVKFQPPVKTAF